tara:strand:+ start:3698 stop:4909 length:1212 start_codon:yes stop_codon:yes gene_type:complete
MDVETLLARSQWRMVADRGKNGMSFIASGLFEMPHVEDNSIPTMATDGAKVLYNKDFVLSIQEPEIDFTRIHELFHKIMKHHLRIGNRNPTIWNFACDFVINPKVEELSYHGQHGNKSHVITMPKGGLYDPKYKGKTEEWVYDDLAKNYDVVEIGGGSYKLSPKDGKGDDIMPQGWGEFKPSTKSTEEQAIESQEIDQQIMSNASLLKDIGQDSPSFVKSLLDKIKQSKVEWQDVLRRFIGGDNSEDYSFRRVHRKTYHSYGMFAPSSEKIGVGDIVVACDTSGSVSNEELSQFLSEIRAISEDMHPTSVTVISCDSMIRHVERYEKGEEIKDLNSSGRGGTKVQPVFRYLEDENVQFDTLVYFSDMWIDDYPREFDKPLLWISSQPKHQYCNPPCGEITYIQ